MTTRSRARAMGARSGSTAPSSKGRRRLRSRRSTCVRAAARSRSARAARNSSKDAQAAAGFGFAPGELALTSRRSRTLGMFEVSRCAASGSYPLGQRMRCDRSAEVVALSEITSEAREVAPDRLAFDALGDNLQAEVSPEVD